MRWSNLFDDLESQLEHELGAEELDVRGEEERLRLGRLSIRDRLVSLHAETTGVDSLVRLEVGGSTVTVIPTGFGRDWLSAELITESDRTSHVVIPLAAIAGLVLRRDQVAASLTAPVTMEGRGLSARLGLTFVLRDLSRRRSAVDIDTTSGGLHGTIDRVGRDHFDLAVHDKGVPRRESAVSQYRVVPLDQLLVVRM